LSKDSVNAWASNGKAKVNNEVEAVSRPTVRGLVGVRHVHALHRAEVTQKIIIIIIIIIT
jgi:hypothetical protein